MKKLLKIIFLLLPILWLNSCQEQQTEIDYNPNVLSSKDYVRGEDAIIEIVNAFFKGVNDTLVINHGYGFIDACDVSYIPADNEMIFRFGDVDRLCQDNKYRRGLFTANFSGQVFVEGTTANIVTDSLFVDDLLVEASISIHNLGLNSNNLTEYALKVDSSLVMLPDSTKNHGIAIATDFLMEWSEGYSTPAIHEDDIFLITGTATGLSTDSYEFTVSIQDPLEDYLDCFWISKGLSEITVPVAEFPTGDIDYILIDGCHNEMNFYFNGNLFYDFIK